MGFTSILDEDQEDGDSLHHIFVSCQDDDEVTSIMTQAQHDDSETTGYTRQIEIRLVFPEKIRYEKGKPVKEPGPDPERVIAALRPEVERGVQDRYGEETAVIFRVAQAPSIRVTGQFGEKAGVTGAFVQEVLDGVFENLVVE